MEAQSHTAGGEVHSIGPMLMTIEDLQQAIRCGKTTAFALIKRGEIEAVQVGRRRMPVVESVKAYVARLRERAKAPIAGPSRAEGPATACAVREPLNEQLPGRLTYENSLTPLARQASHLSTQGSELGLTAVYDRLLS